MFFNFVTYIITQMSKRVFKFGGASIKDADSVRNILHVLSVSNFTDGIIVASAMGKMTNALEEVVRQYFDHKIFPEDAFKQVKDFHTDICAVLFPDTNHSVFDKVETIFEDLKNFMQSNQSPNYNFVYDQIVCCGEMLSTIILSEFLQENGLENIWVDAKNLIKTDNNYRDANVDWAWTQKNIKEAISEDKIYLTQGFIGSDPNHFSVTLGREGSDYSAAILAYCLNVESVAIWKDVPGVLNADPRHFEDTTLLQQISYKEAIEMAFYGASVIHPKTLQPLQNKRIPLYVKSFVNPELPGTSVSGGADLIPKTPIFIVKPNQILLSVSSRDFSFIVEKNISQLFELFEQFRIKVNVIQNSAISFSVCIEDKFGHFHQLLDKLNTKYKTTYNEDLTLYTIRHFDDESMQKVLQNKTVFLQQINRETMQVVVKLS